MTRQPADQSYFIVCRDFGQHGFESVSMPDDTRESIIDDIVAGQIDRVVFVIECNPVEGWSRTITDEVFAEVERRRAEREAA